MSNANFAAQAARVAAIVADHVLAAAEATKTLYELEQALATLPPLDFWGRRQMAETLAASTAEPISVAEARAGLEVARAGILEGGRRKAAAQILAAVIVAKTDHAPMGDERFKINIEASHLTM